MKPSCLFGDLEAITTYRSTMGVSNNGQLINADYLLPTFHCWSIAHWLQPNPDAESRSIVIHPTKKKVTPSGDGAGRDLPCAATAAVLPACHQGWSVITKGGFNPSFNEGYDRVKTRRFCGSKSLKR